MRRFGRQPFSISVERDSRSVTLSVSGELDVATAPELSEAYVLLELGSDAAVVVDLSAVSFMDAAGVAAVVRVYRRARSSGRPVEVVEPKVPGNRVLEVLRKTPLGDELVTMSQARIAS